ncbi:hypothetical protein OAJ74_00510 [Alphaproteobacteria bacterium]|nr:hypothetical protein [Alphaproteobacteria bacterium]
MIKVGWSDFVVWQCSLRQRNFRMFSGKPSDGTIARVLDLKTNKVICDIRSVLIEKNCLNTAKMFEFMIKQTHELELRFDKAVKFLSSEYYNNPRNFEGSFTATFDKNSNVFKKLLKIKKFNVQFFERETGFQFPVTISKLKKNDANWQYTFWHNSFFNPALNENIEILYFNAAKEKIKKID